MATPKMWQAKPARMRKLMGDMRDAESVAAASRLSLLQFVVFAVVGATGTLIHYAILLSLVELLGRSAMVGTIAGSIAGAIWNFFLNHRLTFKSKQQFHQTAPRFFLIAAVSLALNAGLMYLLVERMHVNYLIAQLAVTIFILCVNYISNALWTFNRSAR
ncbi:GtrA family protein [Collimonas sp. NPDC087041]|uniref:GtrA family protein n=1 Tax=Collimonas sp. NPDC087041 TaxID=3363960 RepID=UPI0037F2DE9A